jgi:hypothetical protein
MIWLLLSIGPGHMSRAQALKPTDLVETQTPAVQHKPT